VYRRASIFSILLPSIVGSALMAAAYAVNNPRRFAVWSFILLLGGSYALGVTALAARAAAAAARSCRGALPE
jgi:hypothetical protein